MALIARLLGQLVVRLGPAFLTASGIALLVGGLLTYDATAWVIPTPNPSATPTVGATPTTLLTLAEGTPAPTALPTGTASRIVIPAMNIDLPVVQGPSGFPYCNVAQYLKEFSQPGRPGTTVIGAHARVETFLAMLTASERNGGASMLGMLVEVYTSDSRLYLYEIDLVRRHQLNFDITTLPPGAIQQLVITTSEGNRYTRPKLMLRARFLYSQAANPAEANPQPHPVICY